MPREASPAFQFYPQDFLSDANVMGMSAEERGVYIVLLCHCWIHGSIPKDPKALRRMALYDGNNWPRAWGSVEKCFRHGPGGLTNPRIERERQKQAEFREMKAKAGQAGGKQTQSRRKAEGQAKSSPPSSSSSSSSSSSLTPNLKVQADLEGGAATTTGAAPKNGANGAANGRSKRPIFTGQRFVVFDWQLEDLRRLLGTEQLDAFDVHEWFFALDASMATANVIIPTRDGGRWLINQAIEEARRRGLHFSSDNKISEQSKQNVAAMHGAIARIQGKS